MSPQTPSIHLLPPPGPSVLLLSTADGSSLNSTSTVPQLFLAAQKVRSEVFVTEQHCSATSEIDADDATSWHWVIYAPRSAPPPSHDRRAWLEPLAVLSKSPEQENKTNDEGEGLVSVIPVGTTRLVPFCPSSAAVEDHTNDGQTVATPREGGGGGGGGGAEAEHAATKMWNGKEAYIKLGRLATLRSHRGLGIGKVLVDTALKWAVENAETLGQPRRRRRRQEGGGGGGRREAGENTMAEEESDGGWNGLVLIHAQRDVEGWYRVAGFETDEGLGVWIEEGIEHVGMWRRLNLG